MEKIAGKKSFDAGYALFIGTGVLCILSFFCLSVVAFSRGKLENIDRQRNAFYSRMTSENESVAAEWENIADKEVNFSFETD